VSPQPALSARWLRSTALVLALAGSACGNVDPDRIDGLPPLQHPDGALPSLPEALDPRRVHLVHNVGRNYLFRGNMPLRRDGCTNVFDYDTLKPILLAQIRAGDPNFPDRFYLVDYSLLNYTEARSLVAEAKFFREHPETGRLIHYPLYGLSNLIPYEAENAARIRGTLRRQNEILLHHIGAVHELLSGVPDDGIPLIVYLHCEAGCDRTGWFIAAYRMSQQTVSYREAIERNTRECGRRPNHYSINATEWYCDFLVAYHAHDPSLCTR
jgi:hypothetical protein